jgi:DNA-binding MarR family transcriptional regulator
MDLSQKIIRALTQIQEYSSLLTHGPECGFDSLNLAEVHCIDRIGCMDFANVTKVANEMNMTRGAISKISRKLLAKSFIDSFQRDQNRKEIYFRLTAAGRQVFETHRKCHTHAMQEKAALLASYTEDEQAVILNFLNDLNRMNEGKLAGKSAHGDTCTICGQQS